MIILRNIEPEDVSKIMYIRSHTRENRLSPDEMSEAGLTADYIREKLATTHSGWLASVDGIESGFIIVDLEYIEIWVVAVLAQYEGRGIGHMLLDKAAGYLFAHGNQRITLETPADQSLRAHKLYKAAGWAVIEKNEDSWTYSLEQGTDHSNK